ncbi:MAG TPA: serine hydrolase domain-containing protein [Mycobacteriales bacterium]|nr:serine hydrolase domain-containing protein [Mycobacteriales bacterium]
MSSRHRRREHVLAICLAVCLAACDSGSGRDGASVESATASSSPGSDVVAFPTAEFAAITEGPVSPEAAATLQAVVREMAGRGGMAVTVMTAAGTWSGAVGKADGVRDVRTDDQFAIGSVTKPLIAAQVMQLVEAGRLELDDPASDHLPADLDFDTNGATIRQLLGMRSGIPDYVDAIWASLSTDRRRTWGPGELLRLVPDDRSPTGGEPQYSSTNYLLLGLIIERVAGRPVAEVLREGVLDHEGLDRLVYQPAEVPTEPMAMPGGEPRSAFTKGGGLLPSFAGATAAGPAGGMVSDSGSLARWWRSFCAGQVVSLASVSEMATLDRGYGLGLYGVAGPDERSVGHAGEQVGYVAWAGCLPAYRGVIVVLSNRVVEDIGAIARPFVAAVASGLG